MTTEIFPISAAASKLIFNEFAFSQKIKGHDGLYWVSDTFKKFRWLKTDFEDKGISILAVDSDSLKRKLL